MTPVTCFVSGKGILSDLGSRRLFDGSRMQWMRRVINVLVLQVLAYDGQGKTENALRALERALMLAEPEGQMRAFLDAGEPMARLLYRAVSQNIVPRYAGRLLAEFDAWFSSEAACEAYLYELRWPEEFECPGCGSCGEGWRTGRGHVRCRERGRQTSTTAGTLFEGTRKPLRMWFQAIWHLTNQKHGVSALGLQRVLGLGSYQTAWTWMHKLRRAMVRP